MGYYGKEVDATVDIHDEKQVSEYVKSFLDAETAKWGVDVVDSCVTDTTYYAAVKTGSYKKSRVEPVVMSYYINEEENGQHAMFWRDLQECGLNDLVNEHCFCPERILEQLSPPVHYDDKVWRETCRKNHLVEKELEKMPSSARERFRWESYFVSPVAMSHDEIRSHVCDMVREDFGSCIVGEPVAHKNAVYAALKAGEEVIPLIRPLEIDYCGDGRSSYEYWDVLGDFCKKKSLAKCPEEILARLTPVRTETAQNWRDACHEYNAKEAKRVAAQQEKRDARKDTVKTSLKGKPAKKNNVHVNDSLSDGR